MTADVGSHRHLKVQVSDASDEGSIRSSLKVDAPCNALLLSSDTAFRAPQAPREYQAGDADSGVDNTSSSIGADLDHTVNDDLHGPAAQGHAVQDRCPQWQTTIQEWKRIQKHPPKGATLGGSGEPPFSKFAFEDWAWLSIRYELHLLMCGFGEVSPEAGRPVLTLKQLGFRYVQVTKRPFTLTDYGFCKFSDLAAIIHDTVEYTRDGLCIMPTLNTHTKVDQFVTLTKCNRRERMRRINRGDESVLLRFRHTPNQIRQRLRRTHLVLFL